MNSGGPCRRYRRRSSVRWRQWWARTAYQWRRRESRRWPSYRGTGWCECACRDCVARRRWPVSCQPLRRTWWQSGSASEQCATAPSSRPSSSTQQPGPASTSRSRPPRPSLVASINSLSHFKGSRSSALWRINSPVQKDNDSHHD